MNESSVGNIMVNGQVLRPGQAILVGPNGEQKIIERPVQSQLSVIESTVTEVRDGLNLLLQSHAALEKRMDERFDNVLEVLQMLASSLNVIDERRIYPMVEQVAGLAQRLEAIERYQDRIYIIASQAIEGQEKIQRDIEMLKTEHLKGFSFIKPRKKRKRK